MNSVASFCNPVSVFLRQTHFVKFTLKFSSSAIILQSYTYFCRLPSAHWPNVDRGPCGGWHCPDRLDCVAGLENIPNTSRQTRIRKFYGRNEKETVDQGDALLTADLYAVVWSFNQFKWWTFLTVLNVCACIAEPSVWTLHFFNSVFFASGRQSHLLESVSSYRKPRFHRAGENVSAEKCPQYHISAAGRIRTHGGVENITRNVAETNQKRNFKNGIELP